MSWIRFFTFIILFINVASAESLYTTVFNVLESQKTERLLILSAADGRIYKTSKSESNLKRFQSLIGKVVRLEYFIEGKEAIIANVELADPNEIDQTVMDLNHFQYNELREFAPTDVKTIDQATDIFNNMLNDGDKNRSQCFKRAHIWAYDMWSKLGVNSEKIFIFYTKRYAILEDFEWWFHVAPMIKVSGQDYVLDGTFMEKPILLKNWVKHFMNNNNVTCPTITKYQQFEDNQWTRLCYLMRVPMYFFNPLSIENRDKFGTKRNHWILEELQDARKAFSNWREEYEGLDTGKRIRKY